DLDGGECTIPYTAHQTNPVPVKDKYEIMVWRGRFTGPAPKSALVGLNPVKWVLSEDDVPPDAFLDQHEHANYVCRVKHGERGWRIGTMNKLRDVRQVDGKTLPLARTCYVKQGDKVVHYRKYEVLVFKNGYSGRWHRLDGSLPKTAVRVTFSDGEEIHVCANLRQGELQSGTFIKGVCTLPSDKNSGHTDGAVRILVADKLELAEGASGGDFGGEYRCLVEAGKSDRAVFLLITAKGRDSAGGPFKVAMQQGAAENQKFDLNLPGQSGIGLHYPNAFSFAKRQMVVAHGAQALGANKKLDTFVALMNLSDTSGDGSQLRMTTLSAELTPIVDDDGSKQSAAKPGTGEGRAWRCQRIRKF
ncbi:MAG TPA: hypothetical protein DCE33_12975, partial [Rhodospirillaceae bacterium]|nr:hypothetical protein [Rhodospirillaceae bacterium]